MRWIFATGLALVALACGGCGGKLEDEPTATITGENLPKATAATGCAGACDRFRACDALHDPASCLRDCAEQFPDPGSAARWGSCITALSCPRIVEGMSMNYGPLGECMSRAKGR
ncbi:MAG TPA: hypothetical protein VLT33_48230 [Labilithrix sp.]|nr:hypothetical protein [Labilithrix sp.]